MRRRWSWSSSASRRNLRGLAEELGISLVPRAPVTGATDGDPYGNLEALPDGRWYVGDEISGTLRNTLAARGPLTAVPTRWLEVGHVDEVYSLLPDRTLVQADPLRALVLLAFAPASECPSATSPRNAFPW